MAKKRTTKEWIAQARKVHLGKYDYTNTVYTDSYTKMIITCPLHGNFEQTSKNHLQGRGCPECRNKTVANRLRKSANEVIIEFIKVHGNRYKYNKMNYVDMHTKVKIICPEHGEFEQIPRAHLTKQGCPSCAKTGFDKSKPGILYYLKVEIENGKHLYKIGITNRSVNERFRLTDLKKIEIVKVEEFKSGKDAWDKEREILSKYKEYKYIGPDVLDSGNTELFTVDVLSLE